MAIYAYGKRTPKIAESAWIFPSADVIGKVSIDENVYVGAGAVIRGDYGKIIIGAGAAIEENVTIHARHSGITTIEEDVTVGHAAMLHNCTLKKNCVVGMNSVVSDYAEIGEWAIIAEGAVVSGKTVVPPGTVWAGVPAKQIGTVTENHKKFWGAAKAVYQELARKYPKKLRKID